MKDTAKQDGRIMANCLNTLQGGLDTYEKCWHSLQEMYTPFHVSEFKENFYSNLSE